jgi:hypothetical protein|tara:strand:- start:1611 stop:1847 length:237 start_codon:yes stop_codon:yes gene_type:complete
VCFSTSLDLVGCCSTGEQVAVPTAITESIVTPSATMGLVARSSNRVPSFFLGFVVGTVITAVAIAASSTVVIRFIDAG